MSTEIKNRFLANAVAGDVIDWSALVGEIAAELAGKTTTISQADREIAELELMQAMAARLATYRAVKIRAVLDGRKQAEAIVRRVAEAEPTGGIGFAELLTALEMKKANLSMQVKYLEENDLVRCHRRGKYVVVQLSPMAHKFAVSQRWVDAPRIEWEVTATIGARPASRWSARS